MARQRATVRSRVRRDDGEIIEFETSFDVEAADRPSAQEAALARLAGLYGNCGWLLDGTRARWYVDVAR